MVDEGGKTKKGPISEAVKDALGGLGPAEKEAALESLREPIDDEVYGLAVGDEGAPAARPRCGLPRLVKRGRDAKGAQRHLCPECGRSPSGSSRKTMGATKPPRSTWMRHAECFVGQKTLRECAGECGVSLVMPILAMQHIHSSTYDTVWREYRKKPLVFFDYWEARTVSTMG